MEELIAEISSCFIAAAVPIPQWDDLSNHKAYIQSWIKQMESDPKWIFRASQEASKVADYILHFSGKAEDWKPGDEISSVGGSMLSDTDKSAREMSPA